MANITDLPNEVLLSIIAEISPLYLDPLMLSCKRLFNLCADVTKKYELVGSRLAKMQNHELMGTVCSKPSLALYPRDWTIPTRDDSDDDSLEDLAGEIKAQIRQNAYTASLKTKSSTFHIGDLIAPLMIVRLLDLRKIHVSIFRHRLLLDTLSHIVQASHNPILRKTESLALGRLTVAHVYAAGSSVHATGLAILFAMLPSLRKLRVTNMLSSESFVSSHRYHRSEVIDMYIEGSIDLNFSVELVKRTYALQKFTHIHSITLDSPKIETRRLSELLKQHARQSLIFLKILAEKGAGAGRRNLRRIDIDLSLGSLRAFTTLKTLVTCVDMMMKTHDHRESETGTWTVQRLTAWLPPSLEMLVLHQGLGKWDKDTLRLLFRGFREKKQQRVQNLKLINFVGLPDFDKLMPEGVKIACLDVGVKVGYTSHTCRNPDCTQVSDQLKNWEGLPWVAPLGFCCG